MQSTMSNETSQPEQNQSTASTKKSISILIRPDNVKDMEDFIYISNYKAGAKHRRVISELAQKYRFSIKDYKHGKISFSIDFAGLQQQQNHQQ
jgi:hypothetical protein